jgi:hypothetical protein
LEDRTVPLDQIIRGHRLYQIIPYRDPFGMRSPIRFVVLCAGERIGGGRTRKECMEWIDRHARQDLAPEQIAAVHAEQEHEAAGLELLAQFRRQLRKQQFPFSPFLW